MYRRLWITVNQTNRWVESVFRGSVWGPATFNKVTAGSQWNLDKNRLCQNVRNVPKMSGCSKNVGKERKVKTPVGKKCPLKTVALLVDEKEKAIESSRGRAQSWWRPSPVWEARVECRWHGKVAWTSNEDTTPKKWKTSTNIKNKQQHKNLLGVLPSKYHLWEFLAWLYMIICDYWWLFVIIKIIIYDYDDYFIIILWLFVVVSNLCLFYYNILVPYV